MTCERCKEEFSAMGFHNHVDSKACEENIITRPTRLKVAQRRRNMMQTKRPVTKTFINACENRNLLELIGAEEQYTKYVPPENGKPCRVNEEWWVDFWAAELYTSFSGSGQSPNPAYDILVKVAAMEPDQREKAINLYMLAAVDL